MNSFNHKKKESNFQTTLNMLIYDYLIKMKYESTAKMFFNEAELKDQNSYEGFPLLLQWYSIFHDISTVRSGLSSNYADLTRIEGIMLRLENEKRRYQSLGRIDPSIVGPPMMREMDPYKQRNAQFQPPPYDQRKMYEMYGQVAASAPSESMSQYYDPRKHPQYGSMPAQPRYTRYEEQLPPIKSQERLPREERRYNSHVKSPVLQSSASDDVPFILKEIMVFKANDQGATCFAVAREYKILVVASPDRTISLISLHSGKLEDKTETGGKKINKIKVKELENQIIIACGCGDNELILMRYMVKSDTQIETIGVLRGHNFPIISFDVVDSVYTLDSSGIMKKWSLQGGFEREELLSGSIKHICWIGENNFLLADNQRVYVYDFELNIEMMEALSGQALELKRLEESFIVTFKDQVVWLNKRIQKIKSINLMNITTTSGSILDNDLIGIAQQDAWYISAKALNKIKLHDTNVVGIEGISIFRKPSIISCGSNGECKIWIKHLDD